MNVTTPIAEMDWAARVFRPILIGGLVTCIVAGWVILFEFFIPGWQGSYLVLLSAFVTLETLLAEQQLRAKHDYLTSRTPVRVAEFGLILVLLKPASFLARGWEAFLANAGGWLVDPASFLTGEYVFGALLLLLVWITAVDIGNCLAILDDWRNPEEQTPALADLKGHFVWGGCILLAAVGFRHVAAIYYQRHAPAFDAQVWLPLAYFGLGLMLLGQARLALLKTTWAREKIATDPRLGARWVTWGLLFVVGIIVLALLLPSVDTIIGFYIFIWLAYVLTSIFQVIIFILFLLISVIAAPCLALFQIEQQGLQPPAPPHLPPPPPQAPGVPVEFFYLRLLVFWLAALVVLLFLLRTYWRDRQAIGSWTIWGGLRLWWQALWAQLRGWRRRVEILLRRPVVVPAFEVSSPQLPWWQRWRARTTRERVRRLYLALLQRATQAGYPRRPSQTPSEYAADLQLHLPSEREALETLTGAFVQARYSSRSFSSEEVGFLHRLWQKLVAILRKQ